MNHFKLHLGPFVQGTLDLKRINIAFIFQVNCPGCFIYGFPTMNQLYQQYKKEIGFLGVSTAFEDFEYNNIANTRLLLNEGNTVGETKKYLTAQGSNTYKHLPAFPIAFDKISTPKDFLNEENLANLSALLIGKKNLLSEEQTMLNQNIRQHYRKYAGIAETFSLNQMRGTPSFVIFKENYEIIRHSFGHQPVSVLEKLLQSSLVGNH